MNQPAVFLTRHVIEWARARLKRSPEYLAARAAHMYAHARRMDTYEGPLRSFLEATQRGHPESELRINGREVWAFHTSATTPRLVNITIIPRPLARHLQATASQAAHDA